MNRKQRRAYNKVMKKEVKVNAAALPERLTPVPQDRWPVLDKMPIQCWWSRDWIVQLYQEQNAHITGLLRLSVCRAAQNGKGRWVDGIAWEELQDIKREIGYGNHYAIEVYPRDRDVINVSNHRHLWILPVALPIGWFGK